MLDAWRQRSAMQQNSRRELSTQAVVGFLTLLLIIVCVYWFVSLGSEARMNRFQPMLAKAFNLQVLETSDDQRDPLRRWQIDALEGIKGILIHRTESTVSVLIENDVLFSPGAADIKASVVLWWPRLVAGLVELERPLKLTYFQQREGWTFAHRERRILAEQAAIVNRLLTGDQLTIQQLEIVDTWIDPKFEDSGLFWDDLVSSGVFLLMIEVDF